MTRGTLYDESFASNDSVASVEHNQSKPFCCGYTPDHPIQTLTEEEVLKYGIRKEEYVGVLGKEYAAKDQERRLAMELNIDTTNAALFWSKVVLVQYR